jgi:hypothetical protein
MNFDLSSYNDYNYSFGTAEASPAADRQNAPQAAVHAMRGPTES